jgi:hypothetical protein
MKTVSVAAITRDVRDVVVAIDDADAVSDGAHRVQQHVVFDIFRRMSKLSVKIQAGKPLALPTARSEGPRAGIH